MSLALMFQVITSWESKDQAIELPVRGRANAPAMIAFFERQGAHVTEAPADYEERVKSGKLDVAKLAIL